MLVTMPLSLTSLQGSLPKYTKKDTILKYPSSRNQSYIMCKQDREKLRERQQTGTCKPLEFLWKFYSIPMLTNLMLSIAHLGKTTNRKFCQLYATKFWEQLWLNLVLTNYLLREIKCQKESGPSCLKGLHISILIYIILPLQS